MKQSESMSVIVKVELKEIGTEDVMVFKMDEEQTEFVIEMNNSRSQIKMKEVFTRLLELLLESDVTLKLSIAEGYSKGLYKEVCTEYIKDLNRELTQVKDSIRETLK